MIGPLGTHSAETDSSPLVSVITVCFNAGPAIENTITSVIGQTYSPIEYILVDGGSNDSTMTIVDEYRDAFSVVVSEPDDGISDAFNKGLALANGDYIQILNAGDDMPPDKICQSVRALEADDRAGFAFGDLQLIPEGGNGVLHVEGDPDYLRSVRSTMPRVNHPSFLVCTGVYREHGGFEPRWRIGMDYDWLLRVTNAGVVGVYSGDIRVNMQAGGVSGANPVRCMNEERLISIEHGRHPLTATAHFVLRVSKLWTRLGLTLVLPERVISIFRPGKKMVPKSVR
jgi:glycosyltransferase involved in cell wall biosynthesis